MVGKFGVLAPDHVILDVAEDAGLLDRVVEAVHTFEVDQHAKIVHDFSFLC